MEKQDPQGSKAETKSTWVSEKGKQTSVPKQKTLNGAQKNPVQSPSTPPIQYWRGRNRVNIIGTSIILSKRVKLNGSTQRTHILPNTCYTNLSVEMSLKYTLWFLIKVLVIKIISVVYKIILRSNSFSIYRDSYFSWMTNKFEVPMLENIYAYFYTPFKSDVN